MLGALPDIQRLILAFALAAGATLILEQFAPRIGLVDKPGGRKEHRRAVPLVGGIAIFLGFGLSIPAEFWRNYPWLLASMALMVAIGVLDDVHEISHRKKGLGQLAVASLLVFAGGSGIESFGDLVGTGDLHPGKLGPVLTVFCLVGLANALNMIDGMDGLAGGLALVSALALALAAHLAGQLPVVTMLSIFAAGIGGFLLFNLRLPWQREARVFMGDAGSNLLGLALAWFAVWITQQPQAEDALPPMCAVWLIGLPILDTLTVMTRRIAQGRSPFAAGRDHMHHLLLAAGFSQGATLAIMLGAAAGLAAIGLAAWRAGVPDWMMLWTAVAILIVYYVVTRRVLNRQNSRSSASGTNPVA